MPAADFELDRHVFFWLTQVIGARDRELTQGLREFGLRVPEWRALAALYARLRCTMLELADVATIDRTTLISIVKRMKENCFYFRLVYRYHIRFTPLVLPAMVRMLVET